MPVTLRSFSKINLGLAIGPPRPDGFHALATVYQTIEAHDLVTLSVAAGSTQDCEPADRIMVTCSDPRVPLDGRNTVARMLGLALQAPGRAALRVAVHIEKRLPVQGGLGGGSANAAAALLALEREVRAQQLAPPLAGELQLRLAAEVGSDVPLFLLGGAVLGLGRGEEVVPLPDLPDQGADAESAGWPVVIALPDEGVSTPAAFRAWDDAQTENGLTPEERAGRLRKLSRALAAAWCEEHAAGVLLPQVPEGGQDQAGTLLPTLVQTGILLNDFEQVVFRQHPFLEQIKRVLAGCSPAESARYAALSGSGSAVFGLYGSPGAADAGEERLSRLGVRSLRTRTLGRKAYWAGMVA